MHPYAYDFIKLIKSHIQVFSLTTTIALFDVLVNLANLNLSTQEQISVKDFYVISRHDASRGKNYLTHHSKKDIWMKN